MHVATSQRLFFESLSRLRFSRINDGVSKTLSLFVGHFVTQKESMFCPECRQLAKYRTVELCLTLSVQHLKPGYQIAFREGDSSVNQASRDEIQCTTNTSTRQLGRVFDKSIRTIDCQFVNEDADAQQKPWKRAGHASPGTAQAGSFYAQN
jgi:hypothetical protein